MPHIETDDAAQGQEEGKGKDGSSDESEIDAVETSYAQGLLGRHSVLAQQPTVQSSDHTNRRVKYGLQIVGLREVIVDLVEKGLHIAIEFGDETIDGIFSISHEPACKFGSVWGEVRSITDTINYFLHVVIKVISEERIELRAAAVPGIRVSAKIGNGAWAIVAADDGESVDASWGRTPRSSYASRTGSVVNAHFVEAVHRCLIGGGEAGHPHVLVEDSEGRWGTVGGKDWLIGYIIEVSNLSLPVCCSYIEVRQMA